MKSILVHNTLKNHTYKHGTYKEFKIHDPKPRTIHKATVRDRSCRDNKGTHRALVRFERFVRMVSQNNTKTCWVLKCDIRKFFASVDHVTLIQILQKHIHDENVINLCKEIIISFAPNGLPLGNLTSQLFANAYLNEFDQFVKHELKVKCY